MIRRKINIPLFLLLLLLSSRPVLAGPPLTIDDPGVLDSGQWEIIFSGDSAGTDNIDVYQLQLDVSVGLTKNIQMSAAYPYLWVNPVGLSTESDFGNLSVGFKWRFVDSERFQMAFAPAYAFGIVLSAAVVGVGDPTGVTFLPVNFDWNFAGDWTLNGEFGYVATREDKDGFGYGAAIGHPVGSRTQLMFEVYGAAETGFDQDSLNFNIGGDVALSENWHLLVSGGAGLREPDSRDKLNYTVFLGVQHFR